MNRVTSSYFTNLLQLALTILAATYMILVGGSFDATVRFRTQLVNFALAAGIGAIWWWWRSSSLIKRSGLEYPLVFLIAAQLISAIASSQPRLSMEGVAATLAWSLIFVIICDLFVNGWRRDHVINALMIVAAIIAFEGAWQIARWHWMWAMLGQLPITTFRLDGFLGHANLTTAIINLVLPLVIAQIVNQPHVYVKISLSIVALTLLIDEFFASSRAGWVAGAVGLGTMIGLIGWANRQHLLILCAKWMRLHIIFRVVLITVAIAAAVVLGGLLIRQAQHGTHYSLISSRQQIWANAWQLFLIQPLTGLGPDTFAWFYPLVGSDIWPHAHSIIFQTLADSGVLGLLSLAFLTGAGAWGLWRAWQSPQDTITVAALIGGIIGVAVHHLFDYFFDAPAFIFIFVIIAALIYTPLLNAPRYSPRVIALPLAALVAFGAFSLRGAMFSAQGVELAMQNKWDEAAEKFAQAVESDPDFPLYWEHAAQSYARSANSQRALPFAQRATRDEPHWAINHAILGALTRNTEIAREATRRASDSKLMWLNWGAVAEENGDAASATEAYSQSLTLGVSPNAVFWKQTDIRIHALAKWQMSRPRDDSALTKGWLALAEGDPQKAILFFNQAKNESPFSSEPFTGLGYAFLLQSDIARAKESLKIGTTFYMTAPEQQLNLIMLEGDIATAEGNRDQAMNAYLTLFSAYNDYTSAGPASYGYPWRTWVAYKREGTPSNLVPQLARADFTNETDQRMATLAAWYIENNQQDLGCLILERVRREAAKSKSGTLFDQMCSR